MRKRTWRLVLGILPIALAGGGAWQYHKQPSFCGTCHVMDTYLESWETPDLLAGAHGEAGVKCLDCHEATVEQQFEELMITIRKDYGIPLQRRKFEREWCLQCHEHGTQEQIVEMTDDYVHNFSEAINPHDWRVDISSSNPHESDEGLIECYNCHGMHRESPGVQYCFSCHHQRNFMNCSECHEEGGGDAGGSVGDTED